MNKNLKWNVYTEDFNHKYIKTYNVLNNGIIDEILNKTSSITDKNEFAKEVEHILKYHYWSRAEWEIVITDWPPHMTVSELDRLQLEVAEHYKIYNEYPYAVTINPIVDKKVDVWDQVQMNWDIFIDYVWNNLRKDNTK